MEGGQAPFIMILFSRKPQSLLRLAFFSKPQNHCVLEAAMAGVKRHQRRVPRLTLETPEPTSSKTPARGTGSSGLPTAGRGLPRSRGRLHPRPGEPGPPRSPSLPAAPHQPSTSFWELGSTPSPSSLRTSSASPSAAASRSRSCSSLSSEALLSAAIPGLRGRYPEPRPRAAAAGSLTAAAILCPGAAGGGGGPGPGSPRLSSRFSPDLFASEGNGGTERPL